MDRPTLEMNVADAESRGLADGGRVTIRNAQGALVAWLRVGTSVRPGVVSLTGKWWSHPAETSAVANILTPSAWTAGGQPAYNDTFVDVEAAPLAVPDQGVRALESAGSRALTP
jgi:anaerobic selenocysteine-containing dehydrogenase